MDTTILARSVNLVASQLPAFNDDILLGLRRREIDGLIEFIRRRYEDFIEVVDLPIYVETPVIVSPADRLEYELAHTGFGSQKTKLNVQTDEASLVRYDFRYLDHVISKYLYIPYLVSDSHTSVNGIRNDFHINLSEALFSVRNGSAVVMKVIRAHLRFETSDVYLFETVGGTQLISRIVVCKIHNHTLQKGKKTVKPTIILYLLAKFGLSGLLNQLGYSGNEITYATTTNDDGYEYVAIQSVSAKTTPVMVKMAKALCDDKTLVDILAVLHYTMSGYRNMSSENLTTDDVQEYLILLGRAIYGKHLPKSQAHQNMVMHIASTDTHLDSYYKEIFSRNGIEVEDIYELLMWMWANIGDILLKYKNNDMFNKRVDFVNGVVVDQYMRTLYLTLYKKTVRKSEAHMLEYVETILGKRISASFLIKNLKQCPNIKQANSMYNDNWLLSVGALAVKRLGSVSKYSNGTQAEMNRYHPSMLYLESAVGFSSSNPSLNFYVNPFAEVDEYGGVIKTEFATTIYNDMAKYLPN